MPRPVARGRAVRGPVLRLVLALLVLGVAVAPSGAWADRAPASPPAAGPATGTVVVTTTAAPASLDRVPGVEVHAADATATHAPLHGVVHAEVTPAGAARLAQRTDVVAVEADIPVSVDTSDPAHASNWAAEVLDLDAAWRRTEGTGTVVAVLDTGVAVHPELADRLLPGADVFDDAGDGQGDRHGHGTMTALTVAAGRDDGLGAIGVCPRCSILPVRVLNANGGGSLASIAAGIHAAVDLGADVINVSASGKGGRSPRFLVDAVARATEAGIPIVASAGNDGSQDPALPAADPGVIAVAGSAEDDTRYTWSTHGDWVEAAAPGCYRVSDPAAPTSVRWYCGTSAAAPAVSGALALARAAGRSADVPALRAALVATSVPVTYVAGGRLDVCPLVSGGLAPPQLTLHAPSTGATITDGASITLSVTDDCGLAHLRVRADGARVAERALAGTEASRLVVPLDLAAVPPGDTTLRVTVADRHGRSSSAQVAVTRASARTDRPVTTFRDVSGPHATAVEQLARRGVTSGCAPQRYCPDATVTRAQMATFLVRAFDPVARAERPRYADVDSGPHADAIGRLAAAGVTTGCADGRYCPDATVTRAQMATFLVRVLELGPLPRGPSFRDVGGGPHADAIGRLAAAGITTGCAPGRFCPDATVTRAQMATFLMRALDR